MLKIVVGGIIVDVERLFRDEGGDVFVAFLGRHVRRSSRHGQSTIRVSSESVYEVDKQDTVLLSKGLLLSRAEVEAPSYKTLDVDSFLAGPYHVGGCSAERLSRLGAFSIEPPA